MNGKVVGIGLVATALLAGALLYYLQVYYFYDEVAPDSVEIRLTDTRDGQVKTLATENLRAIDADSSPIRFRACFSISEGLPELMESFETFQGAEPLIAPAWFDCFDAAAIAAALNEGRAIAFLGDAGVASGVDRIIVVSEDGNGFAWNQLAAEKGEE